MHYYSFQSLSETRKSLTDRQPELVMLSTTQHFNDAELTFPPLFWIHLIIQLIQPYFLIFIRNDFSICFASVSSHHILWHVDASMHRFMTKRVVDTGKSSPHRKWQTLKINHVFYHYRVTRLNEKIANKSIYGISICTLRVPHGVVGNNLRTFETTRWRKKV